MRRKTRAKTPTATEVAEAELHMQLAALRSLQGRGASSWVCRAPGVDDSKTRLLPRRSGPQAGRGGMSGVMSQ